jgi:ABC-type phosphonate transport system ATPase subunit
MKNETWQELEKLAGAAEADGPAFLGAVLRDFAQAWKAEVEILESRIDKVERSFTGAREVRIDQIVIND